MSLQNAVRVSDLIDTMGVVTHINYTDGQYRDINADIAALKYLGINHVRDAAPNPAYDSFGQGHLGDAAAAGLKFTFVVQGEVDPGLVVARLHAFATAHPNAIVGIEGPNEVNNWPVTYHGLTGTAGAQAYQQTLYTAIKADSLLKDVPVLGFTDYPVHAAASDWNTIHPYPKNGNQPYETVAAEAKAQAAVDPGKPFAITEGGYHTSLSADTKGGWEGVDEATQAKMTLNMYLDAAQQGSKSTNLYQLLDAYPDRQGGGDQEVHFGMFRLDGSAKPAATAIHNLTMILRDFGANAGGFQPGGLDYSASGLPVTGHTYLTAKSNGSYQIIAWNEPDIWDQVADRAIAVAPTSVAVNLGKVFATVEVFDPIQSTQAVQTLYNVSSVAVGLGDHPLVIQVSGAVATQLVTTPPVPPAPTNPGGTPDPAASNNSNAPWEVYGGVGDDTIGQGNLVFGADAHVTVSGGRGNDAIALTGANTATNMTVYGGEGTDTIQVVNTGLTMVYGGIGAADPADGADSITLSGTGSWGVWGNAGADSIVQGAQAFDSATYASVFGGKDGDSIMLTNTGNLNAHFAIYGGENGAASAANGGIDSITVFNTGANASTIIFGGQGAADPADGADTIIFNGGGSVAIFGNAGDDTLTLGDTGGLDSTTNAVVHGGIGSETIAVTFAAGTKATTQVYGDEGNDGITVTNAGGTTMIYGDTAAADPAGGNDIIAFSGQGQTTICAAGGNDTITLNGRGTATVDSTSTTTVFGGNGNDSVNIVAHTDTIGAYTLTLGAGTDSVAATFATGGSVFGQAIIITDFVTGAGNDVLKLTTPGAQVQAIAVTGGFEGLQQALDAATANGAGATTAAGSVGVVAFDGSSYVVVNNGALGFNGSSDLAIKLTGVTDVVGVIESVSILH